MNILVISQYFYPEDFRINDICFELKKHGHVVTVVCGIPNYPKGKVFGGYEKSYQQPEFLNGVKVIRCKNKPRKNGAINLLINYYSYVRCANSILKHIPDKFDIVYVYQMSPVMQAIPGIKYAKSNHIPIFLYVCDLWPESILHLSRSIKISTNSIIYKYFLRVSKSVYQSADRIGVKCKEFIDYLCLKCNVERNKCFVLKEHAETNYLSVKTRSLENGIIDFMFLGNLGHSSNCHIIIKAAKKLHGSNYKIHFVGDGSELTNLISKVKEYNLDNIFIFHGRIPQKDIIKYYDEADVCLLTLANDSAIGLTPPAKLASYMAANRLIIGAIDGASNDVIREANCGYVVSANDTDGLAELMQNVINNGIDQNLADNGRLYFLKNLTLEKHIDSLEKELFALKSNYLPK